MISRLTTLFERCVMAGRTVLVTGGTPGIGRATAADRLDSCQRWCEEIFNQRNLHVCDEIMADRYIEHAAAPFGQSEPGEVHGPQHMRDVATWLFEQFPDMHWEIEALVAQGDSVAVRVWSEGTNLGPFGGVVPPTGKRFSAAQSHWFRVGDGKLAEHWATRDDLTTMLQLGVLRPPGPPR